MRSTTLFSALVFSGLASPVFAATDGYGNTVVESSQTGGNYTCTTPNTWLAPNNRYCSDDPFVATNGTSYTFIDPRSTATGNNINDSYVGANAPAGYSITTPASDITIYEGNNVSSYVTITTDGTGAISALYKNYAVGANINTVKGGAAYLIANNADGAILSNDVASTLYLTRNSADGATITNSGGSTTAIDGSSAKNASITNNDSSELSIIHSDTEGATITLNGGTTKIYGSQASNATITVANGATMIVGDCSASVGCTDTRTTQLNGSSSITNSGSVQLTGSVDLGAATFTNNAGGVLNISGSSITSTSATFTNNGAVNFTDGTTTLAVTISGSGSVNIGSSATLVVQPANTVSTASAFTANGGTLQLTADLSAQTANAMSLGSTTLGSAPVTFVANSVNTGGATTSKGILVIQVTGGSAASAAGAFKMTPFTKNGYTYSLVRDASDGNWYLQSALATTTNGTTARPVPALSETAIGLLGLLVASLGILRVRRKG